MLVLASCSRDKDSSDPMLPEEGQWGGGTTGDQTMLVLQISPLDSQTTDQVPVERVKTLRIIIINTAQSVIECNRLIEDLPTTIASQLSYTLIWPTKKGEKDIYVIANEGSLPNDFRTALAVYNEKDSIDIDNFKTEIQDYSFEPKYKVENDNSIYLPYTYYKDNLVANEHEVTNVAAYLVPVSTKFIFNFTNKRDAAVQVNSISLEAVNSQNYLFAKVGETDSYKQLLDEDTKYYWVDWLAKVSELSHGYPGASLNQSFNEKYGWITEYDIPKEEQPHKHVFIEETILVEEAKSDETGATGTIPGKYTAGPFYIPESKYIPYKEEGTNDNNGTTYTDDENSPQEQQQEYYLTMELEDKGANKKAPDFTHVAIPNLKALFRNTYVIINVNMSQGDVEVYAEIADWNRKNAKGWVVEDGSASKPQLPSAD